MKTKIDRALAAVWRQHTEDSLYWRAVEHRESQIRLLRQWENMRRRPWEWGGNEKE